jgi:hypothetical protein
MSSPHITTLSGVAPGRRPAPLGPRVWAGAVMLICAVVLVGMSGCFLIGVLGLTRPDLFDPRISRMSVAPSSPEEHTLLMVLYLLAGLSFLGAMILFVLGVRGLWRVLRMVEESAES